jgi:hypothetical protein
MSSIADLTRRMLILEQRVARLQALEYRPLTGTWTPSFGGTTTNGTVNYSGDRIGTYIRIGSWVIASCNRLIVSTVPVAPTGNLIVLGLPFTARALTGSSWLTAAGQYTLDLTAGCIDLSLRVIEQNAYADFVQSFDNASATTLPGSALVAGSAMISVIMYEAVN